MWFVVVLFKTENAAYLETCNGHVDILAVLLVVLDIVRKKQSFRSQGFTLILGYDLC